MAKSFITKCKRCGLNIRMVQNDETHRWTPCDPALLMFHESADDPGTYVTPYGEVKHGHPGIGEVGYFKHRRDCV